MNYWNRRNELRAKAQKHTEDMERTYLGEITQAYRASEIFDFHNVSKYEKGEDPQYALLKKDSVSALFAQPQGRWCVLNFASYKNPGGRFIDGSSAQEESLCHASFLYNVLSKMTEYYEWNGRHLNRALYEDRAIYTADVKFFHGRWMRDADVLTCAAPNRSCIKYGKFDEQENDEVLKHRINFVADIIAAHKNRLDGVILGAFGCGVFKQDAHRVAELFKASAIPAKLKVVYAIPDNKNYAKFQEVFGKE